MVKLTEARKKLIKNGMKIIKIERTTQLNDPLQKNFILKLATVEGLKAIESYIEKRKAKLKESK